MGWFNRENGGKLFIENASLDFGVVVYGPSMAERGDAGAVVSLGLHNREQFLWLFLIKSGLLALTAQDYTKFRRMIWSMI